jgi:hypothetical protein
MASKVNYRCVLRYWKFFICLLHGLLLVVSSLRHGPVITEPPMLACGIVHWQTLTFAVFNESPPLYRMLCTLPLFVCGVRAPFAPVVNDAACYGTELTVANELSFKYPDDLDRFLFAVRLAAIPWSVLGLWTCAKWAEEEWGLRSGILCAVFWALSPTFLGNGFLMTGDVAAATGGILCGYSLFRALLNPTIVSAVRTGILAGLAIGIKTTWLILFPVFLLIIAYYVLASGYVSCHSWSIANFRKALWNMGLGLFAIFTLLNSIYLFQGTGIPLSEFEFYSSELAGVRHTTTDPHPGNRFRGTALHHIPVPLPREFVIGVDRQKADFQRVGRLSYLNGVERESGWWYYYVFATLIKQPIPLLGCFFFAMITWGMGSNRRQILMGVIVLLFLVGIYGIVSAETGLNKHTRYLLPGMPFMLLIASRVASVQLGNHLGRYRTPLLVAALGWYSATSLFIFPHSYSYFNELIGGPQNAGKYLLGSNITYGQDALYLKKWLEENRNLRPIYASKHPWEFNHDFGFVYDYIDGFIEDIFTTKSAKPKSGWYLMSSGQLHTDKNLSVFLDMKPECFIGYGFTCFHIP